jgi:hypothetical protein
MKTMRREKIFPHFFSSTFHMKMNVVPDYNYYSFPPNFTWYNSFFYKIWGEIGNKLGGKDINESVVIYLEKK